LLQKGKFGHFDIKLDASKIMTALIENLLNKLRSLQDFLIIG